jgi:hypothetical protein
MHNSALLNWRCGNFAARKSQAAIVVVEQNDSCSVASASIVETAFVIGVLFCPILRSAGNLRRITGHFVKRRRRGASGSLCLSEMDSTLAHWKLTRIRQRISWIRGGCRRTSKNDGERTPAA